MKSAALALLAIVVVLPVCTSAQTWTEYGGSPGGGQYAAIDQINRENVSQLRQVWEHRSGDFSYGSAEADLSTFEANPILANEKLYYCSPLGRVVALEPDTGEESWVFDPGHAKAGTAFGVHICRGVSYWEDTQAPVAQSCSKRIVVPVIDGRIIAVDADSGARCKEFGSDGEIEFADFDYVNAGAIAVTSPPTIVGDLMIFGGAISSYSEVLAPNGIVRALDIRTGEEVWHWNPVPEHLRDKMGGMNVWPSMAVDAERDLLFLPTGSATVDPWGANRSESLPFANAIVTLRASSGELVWSRQLVHHDLWDNDMAAQPILIDASVNGVEVPAVIQFTKTGLMFAFNRENGEPLFDIVERPVPASNVPGETAAPTQPFPVKPAPITLDSLNAKNAWGMTFWDKGRCAATLDTMRSEGPYTPPSTEGTVTLPNGYGGVNWGNAAYDPARNWMIVNATQIANVNRLYPREDVDMDLGDYSQFDVGGPLEGTPYEFKSTPILSPLGAPCTPPPWGTVTAIDLDTGDFVWQVPFGRIPKLGIHTPASWGSPLIGGPVATAGGLIFNGASMDHYFRAMDIDSGDVLWTSGKLRAPALATPMSYMYRGKQYVVVAAGGHAIAGTKLSDSLVAFALPD